MDADEILDGLALWEEHKPQSGEDWIKVAERFIAAGETTENSSPLFAAVVQAVRERDDRPESLQVRQLRATVGRLLEAHRLEDGIAVEREIRALREIGWEQSHTEEGKRNG